MENRILSWCFKLKDGLKIVESNERLSKSYLEQAKSSLLRAEKDLNDGDFLWLLLLFIIQNIMPFTLFFKESESNVKIMLVQF